MTLRVDQLKAAVVGVGFIGMVHIEALRRLGVEVLGVCVGSRSPAPGRAGLPPVYESLEQLLDDPRVDVVHITTPNYLHYSQAKAVLEAGRHCICEKPLALDPTESSELLTLADRSGLVHCTNFNLRFSPQCQEARLRVKQGEIGEVRDVYGSYLQDWLLFDTDWNWRLDPDIGGPLRAVADIGPHWLDLAQFISGRRVTSVFADLATAVPVRQKPASAAHTFQRSDGQVGTPVKIATEDTAHVLLRFHGGARGAVVISQVSAGHKNRLGIEIAGSDASLAWNSDQNELLWLGHRDQPNRILVRDPHLMRTTHSGALPGGHAGGFAETFKYLFEAVYRAVAAGVPGDEESFPTFEAGHWETVLSDAIGASSEAQQWIETHSEPDSTRAVVTANPHY